MSLDAGVIWTIYGGGLSISVLFQFLCFVVAFKLQTEHFYDLMGGVNSLILVAWSLFYKNGDKDFSGASSSRLWFVASLFALSRFWLLAFLWWRAGARGGDSRFETIKPNFFQFLACWMLQAVWVFCIAMPMMMITGFPGAGQSGIHTELDIFCAVGFPLGFLIQVSSDVQKARWVANGRKGGFCTVGWWRYSRHPNYFGELLMWWCAWGLSVALWSDPDSGAAVAQGALAVLSPMVTTVLLLFVSGLPTAEGQNLARYMKNEGYAEYRDGTSILIPMVGYACIPACIKSTLLCEWNMYKYKEPTEAVESARGYVAPTTNGDTVANPVIVEEGEDAEEGNDRTSQLSGL
jgi:steroid 5-alpha reductase family enzyme